MKMLTKLVAIILLLISVIFSAYHQVAHGVSSLESAGIGQRTVKRLGPDSARRKPRRCSRQGVRGIEAFLIATSKFQT
jgi:hypothetical protein